MKLNDTTIVSRSKNGEIKTWCIITGKCLKTMNTIEYTDYPINCGINCLLRINQSQVISASDDLSLKNLMRE